MGRRGPRVALTSGGNWWTRVLGSLGLLVAASGVDACRRPTVQACVSQGSQCYEDHAVMWAEPEICEQIGKELGPSGEPAKQHCLRVVAETSANASACKLLAEREAVDSCVSGVAHQLEDPDLCNRIVKPELKQGCIEAVARSARRPDLCKRLTQEDARARCLSENIQRGLKPAVCDVLETPRLHDGCLVSLARLDLPQCLQRGETERGGCLMSHFGEIDDPGTACGGSVPCLRQFSKRGDVAICGYIPRVPHDTQQQDCIRESLQLDGAWVADSRCDELLDPETRDVCLRFVGGGGFHDATCSKINDATLRDECEQGARFSERLKAQKLP
ncbi:MAG TPA: hypothetical protein VHM70_25080 [Polyangiaceae bacterium]|nr:hypothetical protein [Polyangiaceae bacterium]